MIVIIGSTALQYHIKDKMRRRPGDIDLMMSAKTLEKFKEQFPGKYHESVVHPGKWTGHVKGMPKLEIDATNNKSTRWMTSSISGVPLTPVNHMGIEAFIPGLEMLYFIKQAHAGTPVHLNKTLADLIHIGRHLFGNKSADISVLSAGERMIYGMLKDEAEARFADRKARINFNKPAEHFFGQSAAFRVYEHDLIHDATCRDYIPLYRENLKYEGKALIDMDLFDSRDLDYRLDMVQEEAIVIGIERFYMHNRNLPEREVYRQGLIKLVGDLSKGRFQRFILMNMHLLTEPRWPFLDRFLKAEEEGDFDAR